MSVASAQIMASFVKLLLDQAEQQAKLHEPASSWQVPPIHLHPLAHQQGVLS
jgi:hypothetical protein